MSVEYKFTNNRDLCTHPGRQNRPTSKWKASKTHI